ncbi:THAP-type domain-containing protein, partial [Aphis craccivora]
DQGTQNRRTFSLLGGTEDKPYTTICEQKLFLLYDMPHLVKSIRNNLLNGNFQIGDKIISLKDVYKAYEIDKKNSARAMCKITPAHLAPNPFQKMCCKLAIQLLSKSVSAAIRTCITTGELKSNTAIDTAMFIEMVNNMFDSCNSKNLYDPNFNRRPMSEQNPSIFKNLSKARSEFKNAIKICNNNQKTSIPPCFSGVVWTITAMLELYESEKKNLLNFRPDKDFFIMTNRLTQDALENLFSIIRKKNGYNRNPTARTFRCCFGHICSFSLMKCATTCNNCEPDDAEFMTMDVLKDVQIEKEIESNTSEEQFDKLLTLQTPRILKHYKCEDCGLLLISNEQLHRDNHQILLTNKSFDFIGPTQGLKMPSKVMTQITKVCLDVFTEFFPQIKAQKELLKKLKDIAEPKIKKKLSPNTWCPIHFTYIIELLFRTKIYMECKWMNANSTNKLSLQNADKLRIFQNK